jgi:hypothetical protein
MVVPLRKCETARLSANLQRSNKVSDMCLKRLGIGVQEL